MKKRQWLVAAFPLLTVACGGSSSSDSQGGHGGTSSAGTGGSNVGGMAQTGGASSTAGSAGTSAHGGSSGNGGTAGSSAGESSGGSLGSGGSAGGTGGNGSAEKPTGYIQTCYGRKCPIKVCDNRKFWTDLLCSDVYDGPISASTQFCAPDGTGSYCLEATAEANSLFSEDLFAINCATGVATIVRCKSSCGYSGNDPLKCD